MNDGSAPRPLTRRQFAGRVAKTAAGALVLGTTSAASKAASSGRGSDPSATHGIWKIIRNPKRLESPLGMPKNETWRYMLDVPFQVGPNTACAYVNMKMCGGPGQDFEGGGDVILFDSLDAIRPEKAQVVARNYLAPNPNVGGKISAMATYPGNPGFVPLGAKLSDGSPHPHAGSGFIMDVTAAWPTDRSNGYATYPDRIGLTAYLGEKRYRTIEVRQLRYDGSHLAISEKRVYHSNDLVPGIHFDAAGMGCAIADGNDLVTGVKMTAPGSKAASSGLLRWKRVDGEWRPSGYEMITPEDNSLELSVVRDVDGSLLACARGPRSMGPPLRVWRQASPGGPWEKRIHVDRMLPSTPVGIYLATDGTPFIAGNLYQPEYKLPEGLYSDGGISRLEPVGWRGERSTICVWPLNAARDGLAAEFIARDPRVEFGLPPHGTIWALDHPQASSVRLADGKWHCLMGYRMLEWKENTHFIPPSPQTGSYLDEIVSFGPTVPLWNF